VVSRHNVPDEVAPGRRTHLRCRHSSDSCVIRNNVQP
jgi:hypothetical protein